MPSGGGRGNVSPFVVGKFVVEAVMSNLFQAPVVVVGVAYGMHNSLAGRSRNGGEVVIVVVGVVGCNPLGVSAVGYNAVIRIYSAADDRIYI